MALAGLGIGYWVWSRSPIYSLKELAKAIKEHDRDNVEKYLDVEGTASDLMDQVISEVAGRDNTLNDMANSSFGRGMVELMKPKLAEIVKMSFLKYVETGKFQEGENDIGPSQALSPSLSAAAAGRLKFIEVVSVQKDGKIALVELKFILDDKLEVLPQVRMRDRDGYWQIIGINDAFKTLKQLSTAVPSEPNTNIESSKFAANINVPNFERWVTSRKAERDLRQLDIFKVYPKGENNRFAVDTFDRWTKQCKLHKDESCRLASYIFEAESKFNHAIEALNLGCSSGIDFMSCYGLASNKHASSGLRSKAHKLLIEKCNSDNFEACVYVGYLMTKKTQFEKAAQYFDKSCQGGNVLGCAELGRLKYEKNKDEAFVLLDKACASSNFGACSSLGYIHEEAKDTSKALLAYTKGCDGDSPDACIGVGRLEYDISQTIRAYAAWAKACNLLDGRGCYYIGLSKESVEEEKETFRALMGRACLLGEAEACHKIGMSKPYWTKIN
jgi:tetratricopeptide (TPR) repeat protein